MSWNEPVSVIGNFWSGEKGSCRRWNGVYQAAKNDASGHLAGTLQCFSPVEFRGCSNFASTLE